MLKRLLIALVVIGSLVLFAGPLLFSLAAPVANADNSPPQGVALQLPAFLNTAAGKGLAQSTIAEYFASGVAGMSAYVNVGKDINIDKLADGDVFQTIENMEAGEYVIGTVRPSSYAGSPALGETMDIHIFAQREGWIVAYLLPEQPTAMIIDWSAYDAKKLDTTTLESVIQQIAKAASVTAGEVGYYHFRYPDASMLTMVADVIRPDEPNEDEFTIKIPDSISLLESSFSIGAIAQGLWCNMNGEELGRARSQDRAPFSVAGDVAPANWEANALNSIVLGQSWGAGDDSRAFCGVALVHGDAQ